MSPLNARRSAATAGLILLASTAQAQITPWGGGHFLATRNVVDLGGSFDHLSIDSVPDLTGDGRRELVVGIRELDEVRVYNPRSGALLYTIPGPTGSFFGSDVAAGILSNGGVPSLVVGAPSFPAAAPGSAAGTPGSDLGGAAYLYGLFPTSWAVSNVWGSFATLIVGVPIVQNPTSTGFYYGETVAIGPDLNADGVAEVIVGYPQFTFQTINGTTTIDNPTGYMEGLDLSFPGPVAPVDQFVGTSVGGELARSLAVVSDLTGDGVPEVAAGVDLAGGQNTGLVYVRDMVAGSCWGYFRPGFLSGARVGYSIAAVGDVTGPAGLPDGLVDLVAGAPYEPTVGGGTVNGEAYVYSAALLGAGCPSFVDQPASQVLTGPGAPEFAFGYATSGLSIGATLGDVDGDGIADYVVGEPCITATCPAPGSAYVVSGSTGGVLAVMTPNATQPASPDFGFDVSELDVLFGTPVFAVADPSSGRVYVY